jgi:hypothetical protein
MADTLLKMPDYTCLETIVRSKRETMKRPFTLVDLLHLEVTQVGDKELYSEQGGRRFEERVTDLVRNGMISTGQFTLAARSVFLGPSTQIQYAGEQGWKGRRVLKYTFKIPQFSGGWTLNFGGQSFTVGSSGSFLADAQSLDIVRLDKSADDIPPDLTFSQVSTLVDYAKVQIGGASVLLPQSGEVILARQDEELYVNHVEFSQCRAYRASSSIRFDEAGPAPIEEVGLPANLEVSLILDQPIDSVKSVAGDLVTARVESDVKAKGQVLIPRGSLVHGRIRQLETVSSPRPHFVVALEFSEIEIGNKRAIFSARLDQIESLPGSGPQAGQIEMARGAELPGVGVFSVDSPAVRFDAGLRLRWRTVDLKR